MHQIRPLYFKNAMTLKRTLCLIEATHEHSLGGNLEEWATFRHCFKGPGDDYDPFTDTGLMFKSYARLFIERLEGRSVYTVDPEKFKKHIEDIDGS